MLEFDNGVSIVMIGGSILVYLVWIALAFFCGSRPFSGWHGKLAAEYALQNISVTREAK
jgi:hypothetical protein